MIFSKVCRRQSIIINQNISINKSIMVCGQCPPYKILLGRERVQSNAIVEVAALPLSHPYRQDALSWLGNLKVILEAREIKEPEDEDLMMQLSPLFLEKLQAAEQRGEVNGITQGRVEEARALVIRQLTRKLGNVSPTLLAKIDGLSLERVELLSEDLLDFTSIDHLEQWLS
jgi:hypothetical protein